MEPLHNIQKRAHTYYESIQPTSDKHDHNHELARAYYLGALETAYLAGLDPVVQHPTSPTEPTTITLTHYEIANLRAALQATGIDSTTPPNPLTAPHTGDWIETIYNKLPPNNHPPNQTPQEIATTATNWPKDKTNRPTPTGPRSDFT